MEAILIAIASAFAWGISDYGAGLKTRTMSAFVVTGAMLASGAAVAATGNLLLGATHLDGRTIWLGAAAAGLTVVGLTALYQALGAGRMSIVAPISATGVVLPVIVDVATGARLAWPQAVGIALAIGGMLVIVSTVADEGPRTSSGRGPIGLAVLAAVGLGLFYVVSGSVGENQVVWFVIVAQSIAAVVLLVVCICLGARVPARSEVRELVVLGVLGLAAWLLATIALTRGPLGVISTITALYPVVTVLLAISLQRERPRTAHVGALIAVFVGVAAIAAG